MKNSHQLSSHLHHYSKNLFQHKKTDSILNIRQPSQHQFFHQNMQTPVKSSRSENKLKPYGSYNSEATAKLLQKYDSKKKKIEIDYQLFEGIFNYGEYNKE